MHVDFSSSDPKIAELLTTIRDMGTTSVRLECEAQLYLALARSAWREADRMRALEGKRRATRGPLNDGF